MILLRKLSIVDLLQLTTQRKSMICEGDINIDNIIHIVTHAVTISNFGTPVGLFDRPDKGNVFKEIRNRDISDEEKEKLIRNKYEILGGEDSEKKASQEISRETKQYGIKQIIRNDNSTIEQTSEQGLQFIIKKPEGFVNEKEWEEFTF